MDIYNDSEKQAGIAPIAQVGSILLISWPFLDEDEIFEVQITGLKKKSKAKYGSYFTYDLLFNSGETRTTRLLNHKNSIMEGREIPETTSLKQSGVQIPHKYILAPMVGGSELAFRLLCRKYGAQLAYTPMMNSALFATDESYRQEIFQTTPSDRPLVCHFSANDPQLFVKAARYVEDRCDAIDLNLGCPQRVAYTGHYGSFLLDPVDRELICDIVRFASQNIRIPIFVKIRLLDTIPETIQLCEQLRDAGASLIAIHGRYRVNLAGRTGPGARDGPAHLDQVRNRYTFIFR